MQARQLVQPMESLESLINQARNGDEESFNRIVNLWYKRIYNYALKQSSSEVLASEISQKTFISVFRNLKKLKDITSFKPWIYRIATNYCHEEGRKRANAKTVPFTFSKNEDGEATLNEEGEAKGVFYNPEMSYGQMEMENILLACLETLPDDQRSVIIMKEYEGMKFREIAKTLDTSENTIKTWLYRGLKLLKKELEERKITKETLSYEL